MKKTFRLFWLMALPMLLSLTSCFEQDNLVDPNPLAKQVSGLWWSLTDQEGTYSDAADSYPYTRMGQAICFNEDGTGYGVTFFFNDDQGDPIAIIGGEWMAPFTYTSTADGRLSLDFSDAYYEYADYFKQWTLTYASEAVTATDGTLTLTLEKPSDAMAVMIRDWDEQFNGGATADNYNINDVDFTPTTWREQEGIYIYDGTGTDVTDAKGRTGYTLVNMPWYQGDVLTNLPEGFCNDITPGNGWEWVLNRCGSRSIKNNNFFAVYNKYTGILRFFYYLPYGFNTGNDHVWQVSMTDHLAQQSTWRYGLPEDKTIQNKTTLGQTGDGTYMTYTTPWTNYMSDDGLITPNAGWWAFDVDLSQTRTDDILSTDNIRLQMRSWNTQHVSLSSTIQAAIEGSFSGDLNAEVNLLQSQHLNNSATGIVAKLGSMAGNVASAVANYMKGEKGNAFGAVVDFAKNGCNLAGIKTEGAHDIEGDIKGKVEGTITLGLTGNIDTEGTIRGSAPTVGIASPTFYLKDFDLKNSHLGQGVWNLKTPPVVYVLCRFVAAGGGDILYPYFLDPNSIEIQLNPDVFPESQVEWIKVEALCTAKKSKMNDDATRLAYGVGSYWKIREITTVVKQRERIPYETYWEGVQWYENVSKENSAFSDFLYSSEDKMGFEFKDDWKTRVLRGRCMDDMWLEPYVCFYDYDYQEVERMPFLEVNVTVRVKMKGMDTPILLSRNYLPEYKNYAYGWGMDQAIQKASAYKPTELYDYQMKRINDLLTLFRVPSHKDYNYFPLSGTGGTGSEGYDKLFDGKKETKWCTSEKQDGKWFVEFMSREPINVTSYCLTTANDAKSYPDRNPKKWKVYGKLNEGDQWTELDSRENGNLPADNSKESWFSCGHMKCQYFRFEILEKVTDQWGPHMQLGEFQFDKK